MDVQLADEVVQDGCCAEAPSNHEDQGQFLEVDFP